MATSTQKIIREIESLGWAVEHTKSGHLRCIHPEAARPVITSSSPGDWRAYKNLMAQMRRALVEGRRNALPIPAVSEPVVPKPHEMPGLRAAAMEEYLLTQAVADAVDAVIMDDEFIGDTLDEAARRLDQRMARPDQQPNEPPPAKPAILPGLPASATQASFSWDAAKKPKEAKPVTPVAAIPPAPVPPPAPPAQSSPTVIPDVPPTVGYLLFPGQVELPRDLKPPVTALQATFASHKIRKRYPAPPPAPTPASGLNNGFLRREHVRQDYLRTLKNGTVVVVRGGKVAAVRPCPATAPKPTVGDADNYDLVTWLEQLE